MKETTVGDGIFFLGTIIVQAHVDECFHSSKCLSIAALLCLSIRYTTNTRASLKLITLLYIS